jgi:Glycoside hydrolase family 44
MELNKYLFFLPSYLFFISCGIKKSQPIKEVKHNDKNTEDSTQEHEKKVNLGTLEAKPVLFKFSQGKNSKPISNYVYGMNYIWNRTTGFDGNLMNHSRLPFGMIRWGGNGTTRYNWKIDAYNTAADWPDPATGIRCDVTYPQESFFNGAANRSNNGVNAVTDMYQTFPNSTPLVTIPIIGLVSKDLTSALPPNGTKPSPFATSISVTPDFFQPWVSQLQKTGRGTIYALDNEPALWNSTHSDLYGCTGASASDVWEKGKSTAKMIKSTDSSAVITGLNTWGWCDLHYSGKDGCAPGTDYAMQGNKPLISWYLEQICKPENLTPDGKKLVDIIDIHWYPMDLNNPTRTDADRYKALRMTRNLFDPNYLEENWINTANGGKPIRLIPWLKEQIDQYCPGVKIGVSEWRYGELDEQARTAKPEGTFRPEWAVAMANAEAMAIMGREGVELATIWDRLPSGSHAENAFKIFLDFDGKGSNLLNSSSVNIANDTVTLSQGAVNSDLYPGTAVSKLDISSYIFKKNVGGKNKLYSLVFNKSSNAASIEFTPDSLGNSNEFNFYSYTTTNSLSLKNSGTLTNGRLLAEVQPWSVNLFEINGAEGDATPTPEPTTTPTPAPTTTPTPAPTTTPTPAPESNKHDLFLNGKVNQELNCLYTFTSTSCEMTEKSLNLAKGAASFINKNAPYKAIVLNGKEISCASIESFSSDKGMQVDAIKEDGWIAFRRDRSGKVIYRSSTCSTDKIARIEIRKDSKFNPERIQIKLN